MKRKMYWGLATLIILLIGASVFMLMRNTDTEPEIVYKVDVEPIADNADNKPPRPAKEGYKWEWHDDHWHEIQVAQTPANTPVVPPVQAKKTPMYTGPLTYHAELLETNPLKALVLQQEERGHWSARWISEIPPDDLEAQAIAKTVYLNLYYGNLYRTTGKIPISDAEYHQLGEEFRLAMDYIREIPVIDGVDRGTVLSTVTMPYTSYPEPVRSSPFVNRNN